MEAESKEPRGDDYEVFLSCRWKDTGKGFTDYLYTSLVSAGIHVFRDNNELRVDEKIGPNLLDIIRQSKISIPIISENYTSSEWCLHELAQILMCKRSKGQIVFPIFYKVEPLQVRVRHLTRRLGDAIDAHDKNLDEMVVREWEEVLKEVSSLKGWESEKVANGHEGALVKMVVSNVTRELKRTSRPYLPQQFVQVDDAEHIVEFIDNPSNYTRIIGIWGMSGIGKTTLARVMYNNLSSHFEHLSFLEDVQETSLLKGIESLQKQLIYDMLGSLYDVSNVNEVAAAIQSLFTSKRVLIVLDNVDDYEHVKTLVGDGSWFKAGSIIIITSRNKHVMYQVESDFLYELGEWPFDKSLILFSKHAFQKDFPPNDYEVISNKIVSIIRGLPLSLEVMGSILRGKEKEAWEHMLMELEKVHDIEQMMLSCFEALDYEDKQIFLDIACLFIGSSKLSPTYMWDACGFFQRKGTNLSSLMSLITIDKDSKLKMHSQLRNVGRKIVWLENRIEPQKRSRLWIYEEAVDVLDNNKGTSKIEALRLDKYDHGRSYRSEQFKELTNLRFLQVCGGNFTGDFQNLLPQLRWLQWERCPSNFAAANFHPEKLIVLNLSWSDISEDWGGWSQLKMATELKVLNLTGCLSLKSTPDLSAFKSLEILILEECENLEKIHPSVGCLVSLIRLDLSYSWIEELPKSMSSLLSLTQLDLSRTGIEEFPESMCLLGSLTQLDLCHTGIEKLPESIGYLHKLQTLNASWCGLARIPSSIGHLRYLSLLDLSHCNKLTQLPDSICSLVSLERLLLRKCCLLRKIPESIGYLTSLTELDLNSTAVAKLPDSTWNLQNLKILDLRGTPIKRPPSRFCDIAQTDGE